MAGQDWLKTDRHEEVSGHSSGKVRYIVIFNKFQPSETLNMARNLHQALWCVYIIRHLYMHMSPAVILPYSCNTCLVTIYIIQQVDYAEDHGLSLSLSLSNKAYITVVLLQELVLNESACNI